MDEEDAGDDGDVTSMQLRMELLRMEERMLRKNRQMMEEVVGEKTKSIEAHIQKVEDKADRANATASAAP
eukprot:2670110-Karenia_brevis.AAC.1